MSTSSPTHGPATAGRPRIHRFGWAEGRPRGLPDSPVGSGRVEKVEDVLNRGDTVDVVVVEVDKQRGRIGLRIIGLEDAGEGEESGASRDGEGEEAGRRRRRRRVTTSDIDE